jgi:hypothetical protein
LLVNVDTSASFNSASSSITFSASNPGNGTSALFTAGTWTTTASAVGGTSGTKWLSTGGITQVNTANSTFTLATGTNPAAGSYFVQIQTFGNTDCATSPIDNGTTMLTYTTNTQVSVTVDPTFTFTVAGLASTTGCNSLTSTGLSTTSIAGTYSAGVGTDSTHVAFGHLAAGARAFASQQLTVVSNAGGGYAVYIRSAATSTNVLKGSGSHAIADSGAAGAVPAATNEFFGYTTDSTGSGLAASQIASVPYTNAGVASSLAKVGSGTGPTSSANNCVGFAVGASANTPADTYTSNIVYTAIPTF